MTDREPSADRDIRTLSDAAVLSALAHPFRAAILDALRVDGPSTASTLAQRTGQAVGNVSYHLKVLAGVQLVEEAPELAKDRRERWWRLATSGFRWSASDLVDDPAAQLAGAAAESVALTRQVDKTRAWLDNREAAGEWGDAAFAAQQWMKLTPDELAELSLEILDVLHRWRERIDEAEPDEAREAVLVFARGFPSQP